ncbi:MULTISPECIES: zinc-dependent metalloprotease [Flavobacterium]|uniref:zinc-dependent metalloprotease n=1 Tax=Flavobacterium TaxID=237 RepID=UPI002115A547|nr:MULTISPECIES: zinc-dependent metalloprotease [Flavobacterium]UUF12448.1 zinc-dependent metalloprotease [Flavobacterium panici]
MKKNKIYQTFLVILLCFVGINISFSQNDVEKSKKNKKGKNEIKSDSIQDFNKPQPYGKVITSDAKFFKGVFVVAKVKDKYFFEIPNEILDRDFQVTSRIGKGPAIFMKTAAGNSGRLLESTQIRFTKAPNDKIFVKRFVYDEIATDSTDNGLYKALTLNNLQPVMSAFNIKAYGKNSIVIDVTDYINSDLAIFTGNLKEIFQATSFIADNSYVTTIEALPASVEVHSIKTYEGQGKLNLTTEVNTSFLILPKETMRFRYSDERVGYTAFLRTDLDQDPQRIKKVEIINRWRLEPKPEDRERYAKGELVEPQKPIVFYINPTTPKKWVPYIIRAVNDWQPAFEKAGFKNAIYAKETTIADSLWNAKNGGLNTINYAANMSNDILHSLVSDPRSGEILQANIQINHNVLYALYNTYFVMAASVDKRAQKSEYSDDLMGELLRIELTSHVGNCLGLLKNAGAASTIPTAKLRDKQWTEKYGISPSIMQNTLFNYVAQPEDNISQKGLFSRIGAYDKFAIAWGYKIHPEINDLIQERTYLRRMITDSLKSNPQLYYGIQLKPEETPTDPRNLPNSLGDDVVESSKLGIKNLKIILPNLPKWTLKENELYLPNSGQINVNLGYIFSQYNVYLENASNILGTYYYNPHDAESTQRVYSCVSLALQKKAMAFLKEELFSNEPKWLAPKAVTNLATDMPYTNDVYTIGTNVLAQNMLEIKKLKRINAIAERFGAENTYSLVSYFNDLDSGIWTELNTAQKVSSYHMVLQKMYLTTVNTIIDTPRDISNTVVIGIARGHIIDLKQKVMHSLKLATDKKSKSHYLDILSQINTMLNPKRAIPLPLIPANPNDKKNIQLGLDCWSGKSFEY